MKHLQEVGFYIPETSVETSVELVSHSLIVKVDSRHYIDSGKDANVLVIPNVSSNIC